MVMVIVMLVILMFMIFVITMGVRVTRAVVLRLAVCDESSLI